MATSRKPARASDEGFTDEERAAMKEHAAELRKTARRGRRSPEEDEADVLAKIAGMAEGDRAMAERIHALVKEHAPHLTARLWYGMPAYGRDGQIICFFQDSGKFKARYSTLGFSDKARLDEGTMWPNSYALTRLTKAVEARIAELVTRAAG